MLRASARRLVLSAVAAVSFLCVPVPASALLANGENATTAFGQYDIDNATVLYTKGGANNGPNELGLNDNQGVALDAVNHRLFVADDGNNRVLVYSLTTSNGISSNVPSYVIGQSSFTAATAATTQSGLAAPHALAYDSTNNRLFVADTSNNRVLVFNTSTITNGMNASYVLGQSSFTTNTTSTTQSGFNYPTGLAYDSADGLLYVADYTNNRVLQFNVATGTISNGENASYVLGQSGFTTATAATTQSGMNTPVAVAYDANDGLLFVAEYSGNNRVTAWNVASGSISNGENASYVLGQSSFTTATAATTQSGMYSPHGVVYDGTNQRLFVIEYANSRVLVFNTSTITNGMNASSVLGQSSFTTLTQATTQSGLITPQDGTYDSGSGNLFVADDGNNRFMVFNAPNNVTATGAPFYLPTSEAFVSRASTGTYFDNTCTLQTAATNVARSSTYTPSGGSCTANTGTLIEPASTNYVPNSTMQGAVAADGVERTTGGTFSGCSGSTCTGWTTTVNGGTGSVSFTSGTATLTGDGTHAASIYQAITTVSGYLYSIAVTTGAGHAVTVQAGSSAGGTGLLSPTSVAASSTITYQFIAQGTTSYVQINNTSATAAKVTVVSVQSAGNLPTAGGWNNNIGQGAGVTTTITGVGTEFGMPYIEMNFTGTDTGGTTIYLGPGTTPYISTPPSVPRTASVYVRLVSGSVPDLFQNYIFEWNSSYTYLTATPVSVSSIASTYPQRIVTLDNIGSTTAYVGQTMRMVWYAGLNGTVKIRIYAPQMEQASYATSVISTSGSTATRAADVYNTLANDENATNALGQYSTDNATVVYTKGGANNGPNQLGFNTVTSGGTSGGVTTMDTVNHRLFVYDAGNNRVLVYNLNTDNSFSTNVPANVLGQANFISGGSYGTQSGMNSPQGLAYDATNNLLYIADRGSNRVLVYNTASITNGMNASYVLGQTSFTAAGTATTQSGLSAPIAVALDTVNQLLYVSDRGNNRVMIFNVAPGSIANGENASYVLGQSGFTTATAATTQSGINFPFDLALDPVNHRLFVADASNNRVMVFPTSSLSNGENAAYVLGQSSFTAGAASTTQSTLSNPRAVSYDANNNRLFVGEYGNNRVTVFDVTPSVIANGENASAVVGQAAYTTNATGTSQAALNGPRNVFYSPVNGQLFVSDSNNNRIMIFDATTISTNAQKFFGPGYE